MTQRWEQEGWRPVVGVWTAEQTAQFLQLVRGHRLYALFHLVALRGLRRGEAAGLRWADLDLAAGTLTVTGQLQQLGGRLAAGLPKSEAGWRVVALDRTTIAALRAHHARQEAERAAAGAGWAETGYVFTTRAGKPVGPDRLTRLFRRLVAESGLPPVLCTGCGTARPPSRCRDRPEGRAGPARALHDRPDRRHLHQRPARNRSRRRRQDRSPAVPRPTPAPGQGAPAVAAGRHPARPGSGTAFPRSAFRPGRLTAADTGPAAGQVTCVPMRRRRDLRRIWEPRPGFAQLLPYSTAVVC